MKPNIDKNYLIFKLAHAAMTKEVKSALEIEMTVEKAVIPIASIPKTKMHRNPKKKPEQIGSGVLVNIKDEYFIFSSTHVFNEFEGKSFFTFTSGYSQTEEISGERFSSGTIENRIDIYDATVFHIQNKISEELKSIAISLDDFDFSSYDEDKPIFMITGFRVKNSNTKGDLIKSKASNHPTVEIDDYGSFGIDPKAQILLSYEDQVFVDGTWQKSPKPKGMSGGAIIKAQGTSLNFKKINNETRKPSQQLLTAITIEQYNDKGKNIGYLVGTRINVHLGLIHQFLPGLLDDFLNTYRRDNYA
jgi:hypothetical protein